jgi:hypothetical protein
MAPSRSLHPITPKTKITSCIKTYASAAVLVFEEPNQNATRSSVLRQFSSYRLRRRRIDGATTNRVVEQKRWRMFSCTEHFKKKQCLSSGPQPLAMGARNHMQHSTKKERSYCCSFEITVAVMTTFAHFPSYYTRRLTARPIIFGTGGKPRLLVPAAGPSGSAWAANDRKTFLAGTKCSCAAASSSSRASISARCRRQ